MTSNLTSGFTTLKELQEKGWNRRTIELSTQIQEFLLVKDVSVLVTLYSMSKKSHTFEERKDDDLETNDENVFTRKFIGIHPSTQNYLCVFGASRLYEFENPNNNNKPGNGESQKLPSPSSRTEETVMRFFAFDAELNFLVCSGNGLWLLDYETKKWSVLGNATLVSWSIAVDTKTHLLYTTFLCGPRIEMWDLNNKKHFKSWDNANEIRGTPDKIALFHSRQKTFIFVSDIRLSTLQVFDPDGTFLTHFELKFSGNMLVLDPPDQEKENERLLLVSDSIKKAVDIFLIKEEDDSVGLTKQRTLTFEQPGSCDFTLDPCSQCLIFSFQCNLEFVPLASLF